MKKFALIIAALLAFSTAWAQPERRIPYKIVPAFSGAGVARLALVSDCTAGQAMIDDGATTNRFVCSDVMASGGGEATTDIVVEQIGSTQTTLALPANQFWVATGITIPDSVHAILVDLSVATDSYHVVDWDTIRADAAGTVGTLSAAGEYETIIFASGINTLVRVGHDNAGQLILANDSTNAFTIPALRVERILAPPGARGGQGDTGDTGDTGLPGTDGTDGVDGTDGTDGATGATGPAGADGTGSGTAIVQPDADGNLRDATVDDVGALARDHQNLRIGTSIVISSSTQLSVTYADYAAIGFRGIVEYANDVPSPISGNTVFTTVSRTWCLRVGGNNAHWNCSYTGPVGWRGSYANEEIADHHVGAVGDITWWNYEPTVQIVTAYTAPGPDETIYAWLPEQERQELLANPTIPIPIVPNQCVIGTVDGNALTFGECGTGGDGGGVSVQFQVGIGDGIFYAFSNSLVFGNGISVVNEVQLNSHEWYVTGSGTLRTFILGLAPTGAIRVTSIPYDQNVSFTGTGGRFITVPHTTPIVLAPGKYIFGAYDISGDLAAEYVSGVDDHTDDENFVVDGYTRVHHSC